MHDGRVIPALELRCDVLQREIRVLPREVHGDLSRHHQSPASLRAAEIRLGDREAFRNKRLDVTDGDPPRAILYGIVL